MFRISHQGCSIKKLFQKISQYSQENTCGGVPFNKFTYIKFLCGNIRLSRVTIDSPDTDVTVLSLYESVTNLTFLDAIAFKVQKLGSKLVLKTIRDICTYTSINFRVRVTNMLLASCNACNIRMWLHQYFLTDWKESNISSDKKQNPRTDGYDQLRWIYLTFFRRSICCYFSALCYFVIMLSSWRKWIRFKCDWIKIELECLL